MWDGIREITTPLTSGAEPLYVQTIRNAANLLHEIRTIINSPAPDSVVREMIREMVG